MLARGRKLLKIIESKTMFKEKKIKLHVKNMPREGDSRSNFREQYIQDYGDNWAETLADQMAVDEHVNYDDFVNISDLVWTARQNHVPVQNLISPMDLTNTRNAKKRWAIAIMLLQAERFDFNYTGVRGVCSMLNKQDEFFGEFTAFNMFSAMASPHDRIPEKEIHDFLKVRRAPKIQHLLLHGMWLSPEGEYSETMVLVSNQVLDDNPRDIVAHLRLAEGLRRKHEYKRAVRILDRGIELNDSRDTKIHEDFTRQRIVTTKEGQMWVLLKKHQESLDDQILEYSEKIRNEQYSMLFRIVEILALFFAIVGLFATSVSLASLGDLSVGQRLSIIFAGGVVLIMFVLLLHFILRPESDRWWIERRQDISARKWKAKRDAWRSEVVDEIEQSNSLKVDGIRQELDSIKCHIDNL